MSTVAIEKFLAAFMFFGVLAWSSFGLVWTGRLSAKSRRDVFAPWRKALDRDQFQLCRYFCAESDRLTAQMEHMNPIYWIRHWNDKFGSAKCMHGLNYKSTCEECEDEELLEAQQQAEECSDMNVFHRY